VTDRNIPSNDDDFNKFQAQFMAAVTADPAKYGLYADEVTALTNAQAKWSPAYSALIAAREGALTATQAKDSARSPYEALIRAAARKMSATAGVENADRVAAGLAPLSDTRSPIGAPTTAPIARIESGLHNTVILHIADEKTPDKTAKPHGVHGCQVWLHVGDPAPVDASGCSYLGMVTRATYSDHHTAADAGKSAYYFLRWENAKGDVGPWSEAFRAKVPL
jgi:hypothetical protein